MFTAQGRIRAGHRSGPDPCDDGQLLADVGLEVGSAVVDHLLRNLDLRIQVPDSPLRLLAHPLAVVADVRR